MVFTAYVHKRQASVADCAFWFLAICIYTVDCKWCIYCEFPLPWCKRTWWDTDMPSVCGCSFSIISIMGRLNCAQYMVPSDKFKMPVRWFAPAAASDLWPRASHRSSGDIHHSHSCDIAWFQSTLSFWIQRMSRKENNLFVWNNLVSLYQGAPANVYLTGVFSGIVSCHNRGACSTISTCPLLAVLLNMTALLAHVLLINLDHNVKLVLRLSSSQHL